MGGFPHKAAQILILVWIPGAQPPPPATDVKLWERTACQENIN